MKLIFCNNPRTNRYFRRILKIMLAISVILLIASSWYGLPVGKQGRSQLSYHMLQEKLEEAEEKLKLCAAKEENDFKKFAGRKPEIPKSLKTKFHTFNGAKLVHLDLKGAPPKMSYLLKLLPLFKDMGTTGLLVEYEDMFPYSGYVRVLSSPNAYSYNDISSLLKTAKTLDMDVIPLIQSLGHFEFVLKHPTFKHLRETKAFPNMPCPLNKETPRLVKKMIEQVLQLHPEIKRIHLGGDEVFNLKDCDNCRQSNKTKEHLFLHHIIPLLKYVSTSTANKVKPIIWDDMIRKWSVEDMKEIAPLTEIMVWGYVPQMQNYVHFPKDMWLKYEKVFDSIWIASSFKGALAADNNLVPIMMHIQNHESWIQVLKKIKTKIIGIALTGWSRYDHFAVLCELLPVALPSLGFSLSVLKEGSHKPRGRQTVESILGFSSPVVITKDAFSTWDTTIPNFPGGNVYALIAELENHISWYTSTKNRLDSWSNDRQVEEKKVSFLHLSAAGGSLRQLLPSFHNFRIKCFSVLSEYFFEETVYEWIRDKVDTYVNSSERLKNKLQKIISRLKS